MPGAFIEVTPLDLQLDGFAFFDRTLPVTTEVTLTAPRIHLDSLFVGWYVRTEWETQVNLDVPEIYNGNTLHVTMIGEPILVEVIYVPIGQIARFGL